jgi:hypothetical protein
MVRKRILRIFCSAEQLKFRRKYCSHLLRLFRLPRNNFFVRNCQP